ncbi:MAG TPA: bifunctional sugar-1-phosphate nucleotidylyltransferase/acetyltransferase [Candidatus Thermoplasmatota archaeon]|nr:bifunctional sugar-1-phosphate nucleotidylyltransferase/acetyltransferase [Candidatus Thermoplasmatota archaeon]
MKCVILAAGEGTRMHPLTFTRPKVMLMLAGKPILEWNLLNSRAAGLKDFIFVVSYKSEMVREYFGDGKKWNVNIAYVNQGKAMGTAHAIGITETFVHDCIVMCGDTIFGTNDIKNIMKKGVKIGLIHLENPTEYGIVELKGKHLVKIYEKMEKPFTNIVNAGIYHFTDSIFTYIHKTRRSPRGEYEITDSINMLANQKPIEGVFLKQWRDVVYPWHLLEANEELLKKLTTKIKGTVEKNVVMKGSVVIGKDTIVRSGTYIEGPVIIGSNSKIGPNCYLRPSTAIGNFCHIGNGCEVKNSIVMDHSNVPHLNYVGDSVIGQYCNLGAGTVVANLRLDKSNILVVLNGKKIDSKRRKLGVIMGDNVQTGINAVINVGTMIGNDAAIGLGANVRGEIHPYTRIY